MTMATYDPAAAHPSLTIHIADASGVPVVSSAAPSTSSTSSSTTNRQALKALTNLTMTYLAAREIASRFDLGSMGHVHVETKRGVHVMQAFSDRHDAAARDANNGLPIGRINNSQIRRKEEDDEDKDEDNDDGDHDEDDALVKQDASRPNRSGEPEGETTDTDESPPSLVMTVVVPSEDHVAEGRRVEQELEVVAETFRQAWLSETEAG